MILSGLVIDRTFLDDVMDRKDVSRSNGKGPHERLRVVTEHDIIATHARFPNCKCEQYGLRAGITVHNLLFDVKGCQPAWVCGRLDALRRLYGH